MDVNGGLAAKRVMAMQSCRGGIRGVVVVIVVLQSSSWGSQCNAMRCRFKASLKLLRLATRTLPLNASRLSFQGPFIVILPSPFSFVLFYTILYYPIRHLFHALLYQRFILDWKGSSKW